MKKGIILALMLLISACSHSGNRFPDYAKSVTSHKEVPIVIDIISFRDIQGKTLGFNQAKHEEKKSQAIEAVEAQFIELGYTPKIVKVLDGLFLETSDDQKIMISEKWKSSGEPYQGYDLDTDEDAWVTRTNRDFLISLHKTAAKVNALKKRDETGAENAILKKIESGKNQEYTPFSQVNLSPELFESATPDRVVFIQIYAHFISNGKFLAQGLLSGAVSAALTGCTYIITNNSTAKTDISVFERSTNKILWHNQSDGAYSTAIKSSIEFALKNHYPDINGDNRQARRKTRYSRQ